MAKLHWTVELEHQPPLAGTADASGQVRLRCDLPAGILKSVTARLEFPLTSGEKAFFNGYQSWSWCPEVGPKDRQRGVKHIPGVLLEKYAFDRYGDYHFVDYPCRPGCFHGFSYGYFRQGERYRLFASLDEKPGYTIFSYDARTQVLTITRDCAGMRHSGGVFSAFDLYFAQGREEAVFDGWFAAMDCRPRPASPLAGYTSWYNRYEAITEQDVKNDLEGCRTLLQPGDLFQIDDGWESTVGDWLAPDEQKFPGGMRALSDEIHKSGFLSGLWLAPFACTEQSELYRQHPDWLLKKDGKPWKAGGNWGGFYALDIDVPAVQAYLEQVFDRVLNQWGYDLVKLDFLYAAAPFGSEKESRAGRMIRAMELLRRLCGDKRILGCGVPLMPAFGLVDYCRVGCDVSLRWDDVWYMRLFHRERISTKHSLDNTLCRRHLGGAGLWQRPGCVFPAGRKLPADPRAKAPPGPDQRPVWTGAAHLRRPQRLYP